MKFFFLLFLLVPLIEIYFLIEIGGVVGAGLTIALVVLTAVLGAFLVRAQGFSTFARVQLQMARGESPAVELLEGLLLLVAGALLLTPGFFTDAVGFVFLVPPLRRKIITHALARRWHAAAGGWRAQRQRGRVIDVDYDRSE